MNKPLELAAKWSKDVAKRGILGWSRWGCHEPKVPAKLLAMKKNGK